MPRVSREQTYTGIYHVMLRGINKQNIFFSEKDCVRMMKILQNAPFERDDKGEVLRSDLCTIYAYCILDNHVHILIREGVMKLSAIMHSIELKYAKYYNTRYERVGHLFQGRFESEAVSDAEYFHVLLRYIHRNPVKAQEAKTPEEYTYSSWNEYLNHTSNIFRVLKPTAIAAVTNRYPLPQLIEWVNTPTDDKCLDMDRFPNPLSDRDAFKILSELSGLTNPEDFRSLDPQTQIYYLLQAIDNGITLRQASRLGTLSYYIIRNAFNKKRDTQKRGHSPITVPGTVIDENVEIPRSRLEILRAALKKIERDQESQEQEAILRKAQGNIRQLQGLNKKTYHRMHLIAEYLSEHPASKCQDIADHIQASNERTRIILVQLSNANIVDIQGNARARTYILHQIK